MTQQPNFHASLEAQTLIKKLSVIEPGGFITYADLNKAIGGDVQRTHYYALVSAQRALLRDNAAVFAPVRGEGIRRLLPEEVADKTPLVVNKVRNIARKHGKELASVSTAGFTQEQSKKHSDSMLHIALIGASVTRQTEKRLKEFSMPASTALDLETIRKVYGG